MNTKKIVDVNVGMMNKGAWLSWLERLLDKQEIAGSNPAVPIATYLHASCRKAAMPEAAVLAGEPNLLLYRRVRNTSGARDW